MDRKGFIGVVVSIVLYFGLTLYIHKLYPTPHQPPAAANPGTVATTGSTSNAAPAVGTRAASVESPALTPQPAADKPAEPGRIDYLENASIKVALNSRGAAIRTIDIKNHREGDRDVILNDQSRTDVMAVTGWPGADSDFQVRTAPGSVIYTTTLPSGVTWTRTYTLGKDYVITVQDALANAGSSDAVLPAYTVSVGKAKPLEAVYGKYQTNSNIYVGAGWLTSTKFRLTTISSFEPGSFFSSAPGRDTFTSATIDPTPLRWLAVENQFFAVLLTPDLHHPITQATFTCLNQREPSGKIPQADSPKIEAFADFPELHVPAGQTTTLAYTVYAGPKEYDRLNVLGDNQGELMNYDGFLPFSFLIVPMLGLLHWFNGLTGSYGIAIILLTLVIKGVTWPLQSFANRSGKRMQALAPMIKELQAKYKEQPEKVSSETMALYRDYGVNPVGGCLPAFIQMPVFFSLYYMLQNAVELRGRHFLWVKDLTQPDTVFSTPLPFDFFGMTHFAINPLPIMVTLLMAVMMRMTPQMGDPQQQKIAQFMPLIFLFLFYNFAAALSLYYVINNSVAIIQIYRNLKKPLPPLKRKPKPPAK